MTGVKFMIRRAAILGAVRNSSVSQCAHFVHWAAVHKAAYPNEEQHGQKRIWVCSCNKECGTGGYRSGPVFGLARSCWRLVGPNWCVCVYIPAPYRGRNLYIYTGWAPEASSKTQPGRKWARTGVYVYHSVPQGGTAAERW